MKAYVSEGTAGNRRRVFCTRVLFRGYGVKLPNNISILNSIPGVASKPRTRGNRYWGNSSR